MIDNDLFYSSKLIIKIINKASFSEADISTDSRTIAAQDIFIPLVGESFDGHQFIKGTIKNGVKVIVCHEAFYCQNQSDLGKDVTFVLVENTMSFYQDLARLKIKKLKEAGLKVIGITGSNGKTTTKELLFQLLSSLKVGRVYTNAGNFNNQIGLPKTILDMPNDTQYLISEMGTNYFGEIEILASIAQPDYGIITSIGEAHLENFKDKEGVLKEKSCLLDWIKKESASGFLITDFDCPPLDQYLNDPQVFGISEVFQGEQVYSFEKEFKSLSFNKKNWNIDIAHIFGVHNKKDCLMALTLVIKLLPELSEQACANLAQIKLLENNRSTWLERNGKLVFLDAYNANPSSMRAAIDSMFDYIAAKNIAIEQFLFILGDMNELGESSSQLHRDIGHYLLTRGAGEVIFVGRYAKDYAKGFGPALKILSSTDELKKEWDGIQEKFDYFFLKASRSLHLESILDIK